MLRTLLKFLAWAIPLAFAGLALLCSVSSDVAAKNLASYWPYLSWLTSPYVLAISSAVAGVVIGILATVAWVNRRRGDLIPADVTVTTLPNADPATSPPTGPNIIPVVEWEGNRAMEAALRTSATAAPTDPALPHEASVPELVYAARQVISYLFEKHFRNDMIERELALLEDRNTVWYIKANSDARNAFVEVVREARSVRLKNVTGGMFEPSQFTEQQNKLFKSKLAARLRLLEEAIAAVRTG